MRQCGWKLIANHAGWTYAYIYCHEEAMPGYDTPDKICGNGLWAYTFDSIGKLWTVHYVVLCDKFWEDGPFLEDVAKKADGDILFQSNINNWITTQALTLLHESYHWQDTVTIPKALDYAYMPQGVADIACKCCCSPAEI